MKRCTLIKKNIFSFKDVFTVYSIIVRTLELRWLGVKCLFIELLTINNSRQEGHIKYPWKKKD